MFSPRDLPKTNTALERVKTSSAMASPLALCVIIVPTCLVLTAYSDGLKMWLFFGILAFCIVFFAIIYIAWMFKDPNRLQSEDYQLARHQIMGDESRGNRMIADIAVTNPLIGKNDE